MGRLLTVDYTGLHLAFSSCEALAISDFLKFPVRMSDIVFMSSETRAV